MSQWGACYYAEAGYTYDQILTHYYVNCYLGLSAVNDKAVKRGQMSQDEIDKEIKDSEIVDEGGNASGDSKEDSEPAQTQPTENGTVTTAPAIEAPDTTTTSFDVQPEDNIAIEQNTDEIL